MKYNMDKVKSGLIDVNNQNKNAQIADLFGDLEKGSTSESFDKAFNHTKEEIVYITIDDIRDFGGAYGEHVFRVAPQKVEELSESIKIAGVQTPLILREDKSNIAKYECLAGHTRKEAAKLAGLGKVPAIVRNVSDEDAVLIMATTNNQREDLSLVEKGYIFRYEYEAMKRQAGRKKNGDQNGYHSEKDKKSIEILADKSEESKTNIQRYIRLTYLIDRLKALLERKEITIGIGVDLSYLTEIEQDHAYSYIYCERRKITPEIAGNLKELSKKAQKEDKALTIDDIGNVFDEFLTKNKKRSKAKYEIADEYFPADMEKKDKEMYLIKALIYIKENNIGMGV